MTGPALWVVERSGSKVFIFAETVGVGEDVVWFGDEIRAAFDDCREFWCEVADTEEIARSPSLARYGLSAEPISDRVPDEHRRRLEEAARSVGVDPSGLDGLRLWLVGQVLEGAARARADIRAEFAVHDVLVRRAKDSGMLVRTELPDAESTLAFFGELGRKVEVEYLMWTVDRVLTFGADIDRQVTAWSVGDGSVVAEEVAVMRAAYPRLYDVLLAERNRAWIPRIDARLDHPDNVFLLVGDSHMPGDDGVPVLLADHGLEPRRLT